MATPIGTNDLTTISRQYIIPKIIDAVYTSNPLFYMLYKGQQVVPGGTQIEQPFMKAELGNGGSYQDGEVLDIAPSDTMVTAAWEWAQYYVPVSITGLSEIKYDSPEAIGNYLNIRFDQARSQMAENLSDDMFNSAASQTVLLGLKGAVDDGGIAATYGGLTRSSNTWLNSTEDDTSTALTFAALQSMYGNVRRGGHVPNLILSRQDQYNRYWNLMTAAGIKDIPNDNSAGNVGWSNLAFNGVPWMVDPHVFDGPNSTNSAILMLNTEFIKLWVSRKRNMYLRAFQSPDDQDAASSLLLWGGQLIVTNPARQGKLTAIAS